MTELSARAIAAGVLIGAVLAVGNVYLGLKTGMWDGGAITAAIVAFTIFSPLPRLGMDRFTKLEDNLAQTTAAACAAMPAAMGFLGALPAMDLLGQSYGDVELAIWGLTVGVLGIAVAVTLRKRLVVEDQLPFPSGTATREVIDAIYAAGARTYDRVYALAAAALIGMAFAWLRDAPPGVLPQMFALPLALAGVPLSSFGVGLAVSPMMMAVGVLIGLRNSLGLMFGAILAWFIAAPMLHANGVIASPDYSGAVVWLLWPGVAILVSGSFVAQLPALKLLGRSARDVSAKRLLFVAVTGLAVIASAWSTFGVHPLLSLVIVVIAVFLCGLCARASGETDVAPLASVGQATQLGLALTGPVSASVNLACASVVAGAAAETVQSLQSFKAGEQLGADPRRQVIGASIGAVAGAIVAFPAYRTLTRAYALGSEELPAPFALGWKVIAELSEKGTADLPAGAGLAALAGLAAGAILALSERSRFAKWTPSPMTIGIAFLLPAASVLTVALGAIVAALIARRFREGVEKFGTSAAAGAIAGEGVMSLIVAFLRVTKIL